MSRITSIPFAAVGVATRAARTIGHRIDETRREVRTAAEDFIDHSAQEGRAVMSRLPRSERLLGAGGDERPVADLVGVDSRSADKLGRAGVFTVSQMWSHAGDRAGRSGLAGTTGIDADRLAEWAKQADLMRVKSIGPRFAALLDASGVSSLKQLRRRSAESLHDSLVEVNRSAKIVDIIPGVPEIRGWIEKADLIAG